MMFLVFFKRIKKAIYREIEERVSLNINLLRKKNHTIYLSSGEKGVKGGGKDTHTLNKSIQSLFYQVKRIR